MYNAYLLRAKWTRAKRKWVVPTPKPVLTPRQDDLKVDVGQYLVANVHIAQCWKNKQPLEFDWFEKSMRGELPEDQRPKKNYSIHHVFLHREQYFPALLALTTRLGVKLTQDDNGRQQ